MPVKKRVVFSFLFFFVFSNLSTVIKFRSSAVAAKEICLNCLLLSSGVPVMFDRPPGQLHRLLSDHKHLSFFFHKVLNCDLTS